MRWYEWEKNTKFVLVDISEKVAFARLSKRRQCKKCGELIPWFGEFKKLKRCHRCGGELILRPDDKASAIRKRLEEFQEHIVPVINYYKKQGRVIKINGDQSIKNVFRDILKALK